MNTHTCKNGKKLRELPATKAKQQIPYWMLFTREQDGQWAAQFGAYSRKEVSEEAYLNYRREYKAKDRKIVRLSDDTDAAYQAIERELNATSIDGQLDEHVWAFALNEKYGV
jgi:hypothetical protein